MLTAFKTLSLFPRSLRPKLVLVLYYREKALSIHLLVYILAIDLSSCDITITSFGSLHHVISVFVPDKVLWPGLLCPVIQLTYVFKYDIVIALASDVRIARLTAVK